MIHILHGFSNVDSEFKPRNLRQEVHYIESPRTKKRIVGWTIGCFRALYCSRRGETVFCWYDFQAVLLYWMCLLTFQRRNIGCLNILLKKKDTMPLTTEAPAGLLVLFQAAGSERFVITTSTATTRAYITSDRGCALERDVKQWKDAIRYYLLNEKERNDKALKLHKFLKDVCGRDNFDSGIQKIVDLCESNY